MVMDGITDFVTNTIVQAQNRICAEYVNPSNGYRHATLTAFVIGVGYELNSKMEAVEIPSLTKVVVILVISDSKNRLYKVETAYPES